MGLGMVCSLCAFTSMFPEEPGEGFQSSCVNLTLPSAGSSRSLVLPEPAPEGPFLDLFHVFFLKGFSSPAHLMPQGHFLKVFLLFSGLA